MAIKLDDYQLDAIERMHNGCILCGKVGSGKSRTGLGYYFLKQGGSINPYKPMVNPKKLYIITTAKKRDSMEWEGDLSPFLISIDDCVVDSWNNIGKYKDVKDSFFIFDEQRVVGNGTWAKSFIKISKSNEWILLSATPGDTYVDYVSVFIANGFFRNRSEFFENHVEYEPFSKFHQIKCYHNTARLNRLIRCILIDMDYQNPTVHHDIDIWCNYSMIKYKTVMRDRWDEEKNKPIESPSDLCMNLRRVVNSDESRLDYLIDILKSHQKVIVFYNFDFELEAIKKRIDICLPDCAYAEWNGHKHQPIPETKSWAYLVQYNAGAEAWNCIKTNAMIFYSQTYSYKTLTQASGRIDRRTTPFTDLYYYHFKSRSKIDLAIADALRRKKKFNESKFVLA